MDYTSEFYSRPSHVGGTGFGVFGGVRRQRGGGIFGALKKMLWPVAKRVGKNLARHGISLAQDVAGDVLTGRRDLKDSFIEHGKKRAMDFGRETVSGLLTGQGRRRYSTKRLKRKSTSRKSKSAPSRKRKRSSGRKRPAKRRRISANF